MLEQALTDFHSENSQPRGLLRVSLTNSYGKHYVTPRLHEFLDQYPNIELEIAFNDNRQALIDGGFDVGTCYGAPDQLAYISRVVCQPRLLLVASPEYLHRKGIPSRPEDLIAHECINVSRPGKGPGVWIFQQQLRGSSTVIQPRGRVLLTDQIDGVVHAALGGLGLTVVHARAALAHLRSGTLKTVMSDYRIESEASMRDIHVFFPHREQIAPRVRAFVDFLIADSGDDKIDWREYKAE